MTIFFRMLNLPEHLCLFFIDVASFLSVCGVYLALKSSTSLPVYSKEFVKDDAAYMVGRYKTNELAKRHRLLYYKTNFYPMGKISNF